MNSLRLILEPLMSLISKKASKSELSSGLDTKADRENVYTKSDFASVAISGNYTDLNNYPVRHGSGELSTEIGLETIASSDYQHVQGRYNIPDEDNMYAHIIGNGHLYAHDAQIRSNAHTVDWNGNGWFAGDVYVGGSGQDAFDAKKLSTIEYVDKPKNYMYLIDETNGYTYIVSMRNGSLISYCVAKSIEATVMPTKVEYMAGEFFDPTGITVIATAYDGTSREITNFTWDETYLTEDTSYVEISYVEAGITCTTSVPVAVVPFDHATILVDFEYTDNGDGTYTITGWKGTYNGTPSTEIIIPNYGCILV